MRRFSASYGGQKLAGAQHSHIQKSTIMTEALLSKPKIRKLNCTRLTKKSLIEFFFPSTYLNRGFRLGELDCET